MSDLIDRQAVLDTIHRFFTEEVDKIPTKKTEDGEVYVIHKCQPLFEMNKAICKRIKALPSASPTHNCVGNALDMRCGDAISRQAVLDLISNFIMEIPTEGGRDLNAPTNDVLRQILRNVGSDRVLPPVNPQPCEDAISRQKVLDVINLNWDYRRNCIRAIEKLPPVNTQEPKTGHWIIYDVHGHKACKCSECDKDVGYPCNDKYCPHCGTRMVEPQERSDKE